MIQKIFIILAGILTGLLLGYSIVFHTSLVLSKEHQPLISPLSSVIEQILPSKKQVIGFLPFWLIGKTDTDYTKYVTTITYFGLTVDSDGKILTRTNPLEAEPGWNAIKTGKLDAILAQAKNKRITTSLLVFMGDDDAIGTLLTNPMQHANTLVGDVVPIMRQYGFSDLNLDIEMVKEASQEARSRFTQFAQTVKAGLDAQHIGTLTVDVTAGDFVKNNLVNPRDVARIADYIVIMGYDYHYIGSSVTGPVAPLSGAGVISEYDIEVAVQKAREIMPASKIILGIPLYGYEWETIGAVPRSAIIPGTGLIASSSRVEQFLATCATCSAQVEPEAQEAYLIYRDQHTGTFHQIFYPDSSATRAKVNFATKEKLGGIALWALGYEGGTILEPLKTYR